MTSEAMEVRDASAGYGPQVEMPVVPEGYKQTEVGVIPEDWDAVPLSELGQFKNGINKGSDDFGHGLPFINLVDVFGVNSIRPGDAIGLVKTSEAEQKTYDLKRGDVLFIRSSVKPSGVGLTAVVERDLPQTVYSGFLIRFRDNGMLDIGFKRHCFSSERFRRKLIGASTVSANTNINQDNLKKLVLALPSTVEEQRAIATALSDVDALLEALGRLIAKKRDIKQATMQQLLTGQTRLPGFEGEWKTVRFYEIASPSSVRIDPSRSPQSEFCVELEHIEQGTGWLIGYTLTSPQSSLKAVFESGDVLFGKLRAYLRKFWLADRPGVCSTEIWVLKPNPQHIGSGYLYQLVRTDWFVEAASTAYGTHMPRSDWRVVCELELSVPGLSEQEAISEALGDMDTELEALQQRCAKTAAIKQAMMQELLTGRTRLV